MADFDAPSFSLGFDLEHDLESSPIQSNQSRSNLTIQLENHEQFEPQIVDSDPEFTEKCSPILRRLRRRAVNGIYVEAPCNLEDEIEDFSSQEGPGRSLAQSCSLYNNAKLPLHETSVLTVSQPKDRKRKYVPNDSASANLDVNSKIVFPKLTGSPLRRFQLLSDSDDSDDCEVVTRGHNKDPTLKGRQCKADQILPMREPKENKASACMSPIKDLWENFCSLKSSSVPTPALDAVCEKYFKTMKSKDGTQKSESTCANNNNSVYNIIRVGQDIEKQCDSSDSLPPSYRYFFHEDSKIQTLVRSRLANFSPLVVNNQGDMHIDASSINYMSQFNHGGDSTRKATGNQCSNGAASKMQATVEMNKRQPLKGRKKSKTSSDAEFSRAFGSSLNPNSYSTPKDASKRRVHADGCSSGKWYTGSDGKKVYVSKTGQKMSGQMAYRNYKKESGGKFKNKKTHGRK